MDANQLLASYNDAGAPDAWKRKRQTPQLVQGTIIQAFLYKSHLYKPQFLQ